MSSTTSVPARISIVTLGVADVERSARFYEALGWQRRSYGGYFADPDGQPWEVVFNRGFPVGPDGRITIP